MSSLLFRMPEEVYIEKQDAFEVVYVLRPFEKGCGLTFGHALQRILLSSMAGYAITAFKIPTVRHGFSTIDGVREDVDTIILNLKQVRLKRIAEGDDNTILVRVNKPEFRAGDIAKATSFFEVLNPDLIICRLDESASFDIELQIGMQRGYLPAEENRPNESVLDVLPIDAIFTPVVNVGYDINPMRVGHRTDYEELIFKLKTDGSVDPQDCIEQAAELLIQHFSLLCNKKIAVYTPREETEKQVFDEEKMMVRKNLSTYISELNCSSRVLNCLKSAGIETLADLVTVRDFDAMKFRNFGRKSRDEIDQLLAERNLTIGMDISKYNLED